MNPALPEVIAWKSGRLRILDQTRLPLEVVHEELRTAQDVWTAIHQLKVRGAPAIGVAAAYGLCVAMQDHASSSVADYRRALDEQTRYLDSARPTAVNLGWALRRMNRVAAACAGDSGNARDARDARDADDSAAELHRRLVQEAGRIHEEDRELCRRIGEHGLELIRPGIGILTHCNAGALATSGIGTATAPMYLAHRNGVPFRVFADETRPLLQGARLTAFELHAAGIDVTLITDNMAASTMAQGHVQLVIVGTDRVAANGDMANKIGTLGVAILARHFDIPFYVAMPSSTLDLRTPSGKDIVIEERNADEVRHFGRDRTAPRNVNVLNPAFDVTPHELLTGYITEHGIVRAPFIEGLRELGTS